MIRRRLRTEGVEMVAARLRRSPLAVQKRAERIGFRIHPGWSAPQLQVVLARLGTDTRENVAVVLDFQGPLSAHGLADALLIPLVDVQAALTIRSRGKRSQTHPWFRRRGDLWELTHRARQECVRLRRREEPGPSKSTVQGRRA